MIRHPIAASYTAAPFLAGLIVGAAPPFADAVEPVDPRPSDLVERAHADDGWQSEDDVRVARGDLTGELVTVVSHPGAEAILDNPFTAASGLRQFSHNDGAEPVGDGAARLDTRSGTFFWQAYHLPATGESCAAFDQEDLGQSAAFGYLCRKGALTAAQVATFLRHLDPSELTAPDDATASARADTAGVVPGVPGWPFNLAQYRPVDEQ